jgi:hypothetical protein
VWFRQVLNIDFLVTFGDKAKKLMKEIIDDPTFSRADGKAVIVVHNCMPEVCSEAGVRLHATFRFPWTETEKRTSRP